ncbi:MAG: hypothetical protein HY819_12765 [Acidobacteria bacterium]|nr:hypothetical protein [Acidobacteriota bacterium]
MISINLISSINLIKKVFLSILIFFIAHLAAKTANATEVYYLFDNSASMFDGYPSPRGTTKYYYQRPEFQEFIKKYIAATAKPEDQISIITFNRVTNTVLPLTPLSNISWNGVFPPLGKLDVVGSQSPQDIGFTRMPDALRQLLESLNGRKAVVWLLTDNIADTGVSNEAADTKEFYRLLATDPRVQMVHAYPLLREPINSKSTLMIYGIVLGDKEPFSLAELKEYDENYIGASSMVNLMGEDAFQMKPLNRNTLELSLKEQLKLDAIDENSPLTGSVDLVLKSNFHYHTIAATNLNLRAEDLKPERASISLIPGDKFQFSPEQPYQINNIRAKSEYSFNVKFTTPQVTVSPSRNKFATLFADIFDETFPMHGVLWAKIDDVELKLEVPPSMQKAFGAQDIPEIFRPEKISMDELRMEINPTVRNSGGRLLMFLLLGTLALAGLIFLLVWFFLPQNYYLSYDDSFEFYKRYTLRRKSEVRIKSDSGDNLGRLCRGWGTDWKFIPNRNEFKRVSDSFSGSNVSLARAEAEDSDIVYRLFIRTKRPTPKREE